MTSALVATPSSPESLISCLIISRSIVNSSTFSFSASASCWRFSHWEEGGERKEGGERGGRGERGKEGGKRGRREGERGRREGREGGGRGEREEGGERGRRDGREGGGRGEREQGEERGERGERRRARSRNCSVRRCTCTVCVVYVGRQG